MAVSARYVHKQVDRAIEDVGVIVPGIGEVFYIANPGEGVATTINAADCPTCPGLPEIQRDYDALELKLNTPLRRTTGSSVAATRSAGWTATIPAWRAPTRSRASSPNVTRLFDGLVMAFEPGGEPVYGRLNTDRPHQFKLLGSYHAAHTHDPGRRVPRGKRHPDHAAGQHDQLAAGVLQRPPERRPHAVADRDRPERRSRTSRSAAVSAVRSA